jgi:predicted DCC family thiol-disulfide oxidoreductase YuxK
VRVAQGSSRLQVLYDADCGFCARAARLLYWLDRRGRLDLIPLQEAATLLPDAPSEDRLLDRMHVRHSDGRWSVGSEGWLRIAGVVPALRPLAVLARVPFVSPLVEPVYGLVARNRHRISRLFGDEACPTPRSTR